MEVIIKADYDQICEEAASLLTRKDYYKWAYEHKEKVKDFLEKKKSNLN